MNQTRTLAVCTLALTLLALLALVASHGAHKHNQDKHASDAQPHANSKAAPSSKASASASSASASGASATGTRSPQQPPTALVALAQLNSTNAGDWAKFDQLAAKARQNGAELIVFPEESLFGWLNPRCFRDAAPIPGEFSDKFASIARRNSIWLAAGLSEQGPPAGNGAPPGAHFAYDSAILASPAGELVLHHRKYNVLKNAFNPADCQQYLNLPQCNYTVGSLDDITVAQTPFGRTAILVCADAFIDSTAADSALARVKAQKPDLLIVVWGNCAASDDDCTQDYINTTMKTVDAAKFVGTATVIGANAVGPRLFGRFLPAVYCGNSAASASNGRDVQRAVPLNVEIAYVQVPRLVAGSRSASAKPGAKAGGAANAGDRRSAVKDEL